jgi:hypothetical protein
VTRLEKIGQDKSETRDFLIGTHCPKDFTCMAGIECPVGEKKYKFFKDCESCWNMEYTEKDGEKNDNQ